MYWALVLYIQKCTKSKMRIVIYNYFITISGTIYGKKV
jgi:hypothetical protein